MSYAYRARRFALVLQDLLGEKRVAAGWASFLAALALVLPVNAENVGRRGDDPAVHRGSPFVRSLLAEPLPKELGPLFYLRAVVGITGDRDAMLNFDSFLQDRALDRALGVPPEAVSIDEALRRHRFDGDRRTARRLQLIGSALALLPHERTAEEKPPKDAIRVDVVNRSPLPITGFSATLAIRPAGQAAWRHAHCNSHGVRVAPGARAAADCERTPYGPSFSPREGIVPQMMQWEGAATQVTFVLQAVSFNEDDGRAPFTVLRERWPAVDLRGSSEARQLAVNNLRAANCWARGSCLGEWLARRFNANPFATSAFLGLAAGLVLGISILPLFRRRALIVAAVLSVVIVIATIGVSWWLITIGHWFIAGFIPLVVLAGGGALCGMWMGALALRMLAPGLKPPTS